MRYRTDFLSKVFIAVSSLGVLFVLTEAVLQSRGGSICATTGCKIIAASARFGDISILLTGLAIFFLLAVLSFLNITGSRPGTARLIDLTLVVSLASEGFFTGYQAFRVFTPCIFCLAVFALLVVLALVRLAAGGRDVLAGFASLAAVFSLFYLVLPAHTVMPVPDGQELVLFYSKDCKYCSAVMKELEDAGLQALHLPVADYSAALKSFGIEHVPTLLVNRGNEKIFFTGKEKIDAFLSLRGGRAGASGRQSGINDLFGPAGPSLQPVVPSPGEGVCAEDVPCN